MANGNGSENANGNDREEFVVSSIRTGMKREFAMMMKAHMECGISPGQRRVTRSQNSGLINTGSNRDYGSSKGLKGLNVNKRKKEVDNEVVDNGKEREKAGEVADVEKVADNGEKAVLVSEEEEIKSDVVDGYSDDEGKVNLVDDGMIGGEGERKGLVGLEKPGDMLEIKSDMVENVREMGSEADKIVGADGMGGAVNEEPKDVVVPMNEDFVEIIKEKTAQLESGFDVENVLGRSDVDYKGGGSMLPPNVGAEVIEEIGESERPLRRFTRSLLKPSVETLKHSQSEDVKPEEAVTSDAISPIPSSSKLEMKMSKKVELKKIPTKLKDLLETGLLEGLPVRYIRGSRVRGPGEEGLPGEIRGSGILCFCDECDGTQIVTPNQFELHAGSGNKRPPEYIYLESGKTLRDVLNVCKDTPSDSLELAIQNAIGRCDENESIHCVNCKGYVPQTGTRERTLLCDSCMASRHSQLCLTQSDDTSVRSSLSASSTMSSGKMPSISHSRSKGQGRLTRKDLRLHKLVFESNLIPDGTHLAYYSHGKKMREGHKTDHGIYCNCCHQVVSPSVFEAHAGFASRRKPYLHIYTSNGVSLHEISIEIKKSINLSTDENDDVCSICEATGELLCCDNCPRAFHIECVNLLRIPQGKWYCRYCENMFQKEKYASRNINAVAAGRVAGIDPFEDIKERCIRIMETLEPESPGCALCRGHHFTKSGFGPDTVIFCDQCEGEYHVRCLKEHERDDLKEKPKGNWLCGRECISIDSALQKLVGEGEKRLPDSLMNIIRKKHGNMGLEDSCDLNVTWRLLHGSMASEENRKFFSGAVSVFHDRFSNVGVSKSSRDDLIPRMIYGRKGFGAMYCAILLVNSVVVSVGVFRIFGEEGAEIPLVATRIEFEGKGYFQSLLCCIENLVASLNVRKLVLPAATEAVSIWKNRFGFQEMTEEQVKHYKKRYKIVVFVETTCMQKTVPKMDVV